MSITPISRTVKFSGMVVASLSLIVLLQISVRADTLQVIGSSNSQNPIVFSSGEIGFIGQAFNNSFNVTATGQTFDFVFGQYQINPGTSTGDSGCTDGPCLPINLTGNLTTPVGALSFDGFFEEADGLGRSLTVAWMTGSGPFVFFNSRRWFGNFYDAVTGLLQYEFWRESAPL